MTDHGPVADLPVLPKRIGMSILGLGFAVTAVATSHRPAIALALVVGEVSTCVGLALFVRPGDPSPRLGLDRAPPPTAHRRRPALVRGILDALVVCTVLALVFGPLERAGGNDLSATSLGLATWLGVGLVTAVSARGLRRWQELNGLELFTNADGPRFAFTRQRRARQLVLVERHGGVARSARPQESTA